jgi:hypothetical protein
MTAPTNLATEHESREWLRRAGPGRLLIARSVRATFVSLPGPSRGRSSAVQASFAETEAVPPLRDRVDVAAAGVLPASVGFVKSRTWMRSSVSCG